MNFIFAEEFDTLNPLFTNSWLSTISQQIWNCRAWDFDNLGNPHAVLVKEIPSAENGGISPDGKVITLKLRDDLVWSDGDPLTAEDFVFTYQMETSPNNGADPNSPYQQFESLNTPDERTVVITFKAPFAPWLSTLYQSLLPAHVLKPVYDTLGTLQDADWNQAPTVGCGPYVFAEWQAGSFSRFVANEKYWLGKPKIDEIFIRFAPDEASQIEALKSGSGDLGTYLPFDKVPELEAAGIKIEKVYSGYNVGWFFYLDPEKGHPALQDMRVRQAIALALDRFSLNQNLLLGLTQPAMSYWDNTPYIDPTLQPLPYDPEKAKQLLDEAGWIDNDGDGVRDQDGLPLSLTYGTIKRQIRLEAQKIAQQQLAQVGIKLELLDYDTDTFFLGYNQGGPAATGQLDIFELAAQTAFPDPDTPDFLCSEIPSMDASLGRNWSAICDSEVDQLFKLQSTQIDSAARQQTFHQISKLIYERVYFLGIWQDPDLWGINSRLINVKLSGATPFYNIIEWDVAP